MEQPSKIFQFEQAHATVIFTNELSAATGQKHAKLYVQAIDQYGYLREWSLQFTHEPGDSTKTYWESHIYQHPGRREITKVRAQIATQCITRFLDLCEKHPTLLFNVAELAAATGRFRPQCEGFVHFAEALHRGTTPTAKML